MASSNAKTPLDTLLDHPTRKAIMESILSRENASTFQEIAASLPMHISSVRWHINILVDHGVLRKESGYGKDTGIRKIYYIHPTTPGLQELLQEKFQKV